MVGVEKKTLTVPHAKTNTELINDLLAEANLKNSAGAI